MNKIEEAIKDFASGKIIIVVDDEDREKPEVENLEAESFPLLMSVQLHVD